ncbi:MAG: ABC transporter ATP-binding protein [Hyphomicrobiaceae bacterium]
MNINSEWAGADEPIVRAEGVRQIFPAHDGSDGLLALETVDLQIDRGEMVAFIGPSGCGKSTLLNIIGGMIPATEGTAWLGREKIVAPNPKRIAYIFQESALLPWSTVLDNIKVGLEFQGVPASERQERAAEALAAVGLSRFAASYPHQLSGGMKQRVALARALSLRTDIMLMDEPFASLDEQTRMVFGEELSRMLTERGKTIILVTHSLAEAVFLSDRVFVFTARPGRIKSVIRIDEPHPRRPEFMTSDKFNKLRNTNYELLREEVLSAMDSDMSIGSAATGG